MEKTIRNKFYIPCNDILEEVIHMLGGFTYATKKINECNLGKPITPNMVRAWVECGKIPYKYTRVLEAFAKENKELFYKAFEYEGLVYGKAKRKTYVRSDFPEYIKLLTTPIPLTRVTWVGQFEKPLALQHWLSIQGGVKTLVKNMNVTKAVSPYKFPFRDFSYRTMYNYFYYGYMPTEWREYFENEMGMPKNVGFEKSTTPMEAEVPEPTSEVKDMLSEKEFEGEPYEYNGLRWAKSKKPTLMVPATPVIIDGQEVHRHKYEHEAAQASLCPPEKQEKQEEFSILD